MHVNKGKGMFIGEVRVFGNNGTRKIMSVEIDFLKMLLFVLLLTSCDNLGDKKNALYGIIYRDIKEVQQFKNYKEMAGTVIDVVDQSGEYIYGISHLSDSNRNILTIEKFITEPNNPKPKYLILDTINIDNLKPDEFITYCNCRKDTILDPEIIAIFKAVSMDDSKEYHDKIVRAWRADTKTGTIIQLKNVKGIDCINEGHDTCEGE